MSFFKDILKNKLSTCIFENGKGDLRNSMCDILNTIISIPTRNNPKVNRSIYADRDIIFCDDGLSLNKGVPVEANRALIFFYLSS